MYSILKSERQIPGWSVLVAALIVALAAIAAITTLRQEADKMRRAENLLIHLQAQAYRLSSLEDYAISEQKLDVETSEEVQAARSQLEQIIAQAIQITPSSHSLQQVRETYHEYVKAADEEFRLIKAGQFAQAQTVDRQRVDPSFELLRKEITDMSAT